MAGVSVAQRIPQSVLETIVGHIPIPRPDRRETMYTDKLPAIRTDLLPYMQVCRLWRHAACSVFYSSAVLLHDYADKREAPTKENVLHLQHVISNNQQHCLRTLFFNLHVDEIECLDDGDVINAMSTLRTCGRLSRVGSIVLLFDANAPDGDDSVMALSSDMGKHTRRLAHYISSLVESVHATGLQIRRVMLGTKGIVHIDLAQSFPGCAFLQNAGMLIGRNTTSLALLNVPDHDVVSMCPEVTSLQELWLKGGDQFPAAICLARRCAETLLELRIGLICANQALELTWRGDYKAGHTCVYPRLRYPNIQCYVSLQNPVCPQPQVDPFPALGVLICWGRFPYSVPVVLGGARSHVHHLELRLDKAVYQIMVDEGILAKGAFSSLRYVLLKWCHTVTSQEEDALAQHALQLCSTVQTVCLSYARGPMMDTTARLLPSLHSLHTLDTGCTEIALDTLLYILCACPGLQKANTKLCLNNTSFTGETLAASTISVFKEMYGGYTSTVRYLGIRSILGPKSMAAECVVLVAYPLGSLARVSIRPCIGTVDLKQVMAGIKEATHMSVFDDRPHIHSVKFVLDRSW